jgi:hypothetical protein
MFFLLRKRIQGNHARSLLKGTGAALLAALIMSAALFGQNRFSTTDSAALITLGGVLLGGVVYAMVLTALRVYEVGSLVQMVKQRLSR